MTDGLRVEFHARLLCDEAFMQWILSHPQKAKIMLHLIRIKSVSKFHKGYHNVILDTDFDALQKNVLTPDQERYIRGAVKEIPTPDFIAGAKDPITRRIITAIQLTSKVPFTTYILTTDGRAAEYNSNPHMNKMSRIKVIGGKEAISAIDDLFTEFMTAKALRPL